MITAKSAVGSLGSARRSSDWERERSLGNTRSAHLVARGTRTNARILLHHRPVLRLARVCATCWMTEWRALWEGREEECSRGTHMHAHTYTYFSGQKGPLHSGQATETNNAQTTKCHQVCPNRCHSKPAEGPHAAGESDSPMSRPRRGRRRGTGFVRLSGRTALRTSLELRGKLSLMRQERQSGGVQSVYIRPRTLWFPRALNGGGRKRPSKRGKGPAKL